MSRLLLRFFVKDYQNTEDPQVRQKYGLFAGLTGLFLNLLLFGVKLAAGFFTASIAVMADAFNNLSDAGSSLVMLLGFKMAGRPADQNHPYGHGRMEYLAGLIIAAIIFFMGFELLQSSVVKIFRPQPLQADTLSCIILVLAILLKIWMFFFNRFLGRKIDSPAMAATALDSLNDAIATTVVLAGILAYSRFGVNLDGYLGALVALFILYAGIQAAKESISPLLGQAPNKEFVEEIEAMVLSYPQVLGIHDLLVHNYGPGKYMISLHAEVPGDADFIEMHDTIDLIELRLKEEFSCEAVIHMDPIAADDAFTLDLQKQVHQGILELFAGEDFADGLSIHDFRLMTGHTHTKLIFDLVVPFSCTLCEEEIQIKIKSVVKELNPHYFAVVQIDRPLSS